MPRKPDKRIREAKEMFLKGAKLVDISAKLNVPEGTVRRWKSTHKWDSERSHRESERSDKKEVGSQEIKMRKDMEEQDHREIRMP